MANEPTDMPPPPINEVKEAPGMDSELDSALGQMFSAQTTQSTPNEEPTAKTPPADEPKAIEKPEKPAKVEDANSKLPDPEEIPDTPPGKGGGWKALKTSYQQARQTVAEKESEIAKLKSSLAEKGTTTTKEAQELKTQIQDLAKYRAMVDIQADPEFISKYDKPISDLEDGMRNMLRSMNVSDEVVKQIKFENTELLDQIIEHIKESPEKFKASKFRSKVEELVNLRDDRTNALTEAKDNYDKFLQERKKQAFSKGAEEEGRMARHIDGVILSPENKEKFPYLHKIEPREGMSQGEIDQIGRHNHLAEMMQNEIREVSKWSDPERRAEIATAAVSLKYANAQVKALTAKLAAVEGELSKIAKVSTDADNPKMPKRARNGEDAPQDVDGALASHNWNR